MLTCPLIVMVLKTNRNLKLYYSIREVSEIIGVNESTLRYWETELPQLKPQVLPGSRIRQYTEKDIELLKVIYNLVKVRGFKIAAARKMITINRDSADKSSDVLNTLITVRDDLKVLKKELDGLV